MRKVCLLVAILMLSVASPAAESIRGVVKSTKGAEPGVWVIAETTDLPTKFVKTVVTDDNGRFLIPDLPDATLQLGRPVQHAGTRRQHPHRERLQLGFASRADARYRQVGGASGEPVWSGDSACALLRCCRRPS